MDSRLVWMTLEGDCLCDTPQSLAVAVSFPPMHITKYLQNSDDDLGEWTDQQSYVWQGFPTLCSQKSLVACQGSSFCFWF